MRLGTKVQLKITATDHDHGFKIANVPDGSEPNSKSGLVFASPQECWQLKKGHSSSFISIRFADAQWNGITKDVEPSTHQ